ncbi:tRNA (adenosine(37)-N6)-dimethylallyltransferase MiaA [Chloroflexota bacterium]
MKHIITIVGPTCIGKSKLAIHLAQTFGGEIVSADSRQVYRFMDIGTAKPSPKELSLVPHHLINILNPDEEFSLAQYQKLAHIALSNIQKRDNLPILIGGSGMYVWAVLEGWGIPRVAPNAKLRHNLEEEALRIGANGLYRKLEEIDPIAVKHIEPSNIRRTIRALEVYEKTGALFSKLQHKESPEFKQLIIGLTADRTELYRRTDSRVDEMVERGLTKEVENLLNMGYDFTVPAMTSIGYREIGAFLKGEITLATAVQQIKFGTHRFIRHQYNWFSLKDERINWIDVSSIEESEITLLADNLIRKHIYN